MPFGVISSQKGFRNMNQPKNDVDKKQNKTH
jgi:hypothetical protein